MFKYRAMSYVTKKHKQAYRQRAITKMKDKNTKNNHCTRVYISTEPRQIGRHM